jgi:hypothetical protein
MMRPDLQTRLANGGNVQGSLDDQMMLSIPPIAAGKYGLAQVDDYLHLRRSKFPHQAPLKFTLEARVSASDLPGTWGFGFWNDPFSLGFGGGGMARVLPVIPNAAWFFYGSEKNYLSLRDDQPTDGFHAKSIRSTRLPSILSVLAIPGLSFLLWPAAMRLIRKLMRPVIHEEGIGLSIAVDHWHTYALEWTGEQVIFSVDLNEVLTTHISPCGRLGLVIWIDNQFFRFSPDGRISFGVEGVYVDQWLQVRHITING